MAIWNGGPAGQELVVDRLESPRHTRATSNWHVLAIKVTHPMGWVKRQAHHGPTLNQTWTSRDKCVCWLKGEIDGHLTQRQNEKRKENNCRERNDSSPDFDPQIKSETTWPSLGRSSPRRGDQQVVACPFFCMIHEKTHRKMATRRWVKTFQDGEHMKGQNSE